MNKLNACSTYRFIRYVRTVIKARTGSFVDSLQLFFDADKSPQAYYSSPDDFLAFLNKEHELYRVHPELVVELKSSFSVYDVHFVLDTRNWTLTPFDQKKERLPYIREVLQRNLAQAFTPPSPLSPTSKLGTASKLPVQAAYTLNLNHPRTQKIWDIGKKKSSK